jgi:hypothetical protein
MIQSEQCLFALTQAKIDPTGFIIGVLQTGKKNNVSFAPAAADASGHETDFLIRQTEKSH